jgi:hypothetical protein
MLMKLTLGREDRAMEEDATEVTEPRRLTHDEIEEAAFDASTLYFALPNPADEQRERDAGPVTSGQANKIAEELCGIHRNTEAILEAMSANAGMAHQEIKALATPLWLIVVFLGFLAAEALHRNWALW